MGRRKGREERGERDPVHDWDSEKVATHRTQKFQISTNHGQRQFVTIKLNQHNAANVKYLRGVDQQYFKYSTENSAQRCANV